MLNVGKISKDGNHVVAGAREMMRYRRSRATTLENSSNPSSQGQNASASAGLINKNPNWNSDGVVAPQNTSWAMYQNGSKTSAPVPAVPSQTRKVLRCDLMWLYIVLMWMFVQLWFCYCFFCRVLWQLLLPLEAPQIGHLLEIDQRVLMWLHSPELE